MKAAVRRNRPLPRVTPPGVRSLEVPTLLLAVAVHGGWLALTWCWSSIPLWLGVPAAAWLVAWHGSLQHEAVHGHPTGRRRLDAMIAGAPLALWLPFAVYRHTHLAHHRTPRLTCPLDDPESYYADPAAWQRFSRPRRFLHHSMQTALGRLALGPMVVIARFAAGESRLLASRDRARVRMWLGHALGCAAVVAWVCVICGIPAWVYALCFVYPGLSLTLLRSFTEHRPAPGYAQRSALVEAGPILSLLYLNNNLHALHHAAPQVPWYRLPAMYRDCRDALLRGNGGFRFAGYGEVLRRYAVRAKDSPVAVRREGA